MKIIQVTVKPSARTSQLEQLEDGTWLARLKSPPVEGRANQELCALVARYFERRLAQVSIKSGATARLKRVQIENA